MSESEDGTGREGLPHSRHRLERRYRMSTGPSLFSVMVISRHKFKKINNLTGPIAFV